MVTGGTQRRGSSLLEVIVALVVLAVGLAGVAGTIVLAAGTMATAAEAQRASGAALSLADSLLRFQVKGMGSVDRPPFRVTWRPAGEEWIVEAVREGTGEVIAHLAIPRVE